MFLEQQNYSLLVLVQFLLFVLQFYFIPAGSWLQALYFWYCKLLFCSRNTLYDKMLVQVSDESMWQNIQLWLCLWLFRGGFLFLINAAMTIKPEFFGLSSVSVQCVGLF